MNGRMTKKCGLSFKGCSKIPIHQIHLHGKMIHYGTKIAYIYVRTPNYLTAILIIQPDWLIEERDEWKNDEKVWTLIQRLQQDMEK
jgi:hypothetical protein